MLDDERCLAVAQQDLGLEILQDGNQRRIAAQLFINDQRFVRAEKIFPNAELRMSYSLGREFTP